MKIINNNAIPEHIAIYLAATTYKPVQNYIRVTELIRSPHAKRLAIERWDDICVDSRKLVTALYGDGLHMVMQKIANHTSMFETHAVVFPEQTLELEIEGIVLKGTIDLYKADNKLMFYVDDYKSILESSLKKGIKPEWESQTNIYAFLLNQYDKKVDKINIIALIKDWSYEQSLYKNTYSYSPIVTIPIEKWSNKRAESFILDRIKYHKSVFEMTEEEFLASGGCTPEDRWHRPDVWACKKPANVKSKLFNSLEQAELNKKPGEEITFRPGLDVFCEHYCTVANVCPFRSKNNNESCNNELHVCQS